MKLGVMGLLIVVAAAACSNDAASPGYSRNATAAVPTINIAASVVPAGCLSFRSTGFGSFTGDTWAGSLHTLIGGKALVSVPGPLGGGDLTERAIDHIIKGLPYRGDETLQWNYTDGAIFAEDSYTGSPGTVEGLWNYHAQGKFTGGTGRFEGATGSFETEGPFLMYPALDGPNDGVVIMGTVGHICLK